MTNACKGHLHVYNPITPLYPLNPKTTCFRMRNDRGERMHPPRSTLYTRRPTQHTTSPAQLEWTHSYAVTVEWTPRIQHFATVSAAGVPAFCGAALAAIGASAVQYYAPYVFANGTAPTNHSLLDHTHYSMKKKTASTEKKISPPLSGQSSGCEQYRSEQPQKYQEQPGQRSPGTDHPSECHPQCLQTRH